MSPRTEAQFEEIRKERRTQIMEAALNLFANHGYKNTSISDISKEAKISKGLLYNYFDSKEKLLEVIIHKGIDELEQLLGNEHGNDITPKQMEEFILKMVHLIKTKMEFWRLYMQISIQPSVFGLISKKIDEIYRPIMFLLIRYFKNLGYQNPEMEAIIFGTLLDGLTFDYILKPDLFPIDELALELINRYCSKNS